MPSVFLAAHGAAPRRDDAAAAVQSAHGPLLRVQKGVHPARVQNFLEECALPLLNQQVHVHKAVAQGFGQQNTYRALARARHTDQDDVVLHRAVPNLYRQNQLIL